MYLIYWMGTTTEELFSSIIYFIYDKWYDKKAYFLAITQLFFKKL